MKSKHIYIFTGIGFFLFLILIASCNKMPKNQEELMGYINNPKENLCFTETYEAFQLKVTYWPKQLLNLPSLSANKEAEMILYFRFDITMNDERTSNIALYNNLKKELSLNLNKIISLQQCNTDCDLFSSSFMPFYGHLPTDVLLVSFKVNKGCSNNYELNFNGQVFNVENSTFTFSENKIKFLNKLNYE